MTSYCLGFSYRPLIPEGNVHAAAEEEPKNDTVYICWPPKHCDDEEPKPRVFTKLIHSPIAPGRKPVRAVSIDSFHATSLHADKEEILSRDSEDALLDHVFLGMLTLQYQARPDVVRLVEQLDKACIRFVQFSKENELRSRIFAEKMGLEAGWNCHVSLASEGSADILRSQSISCHSQKDYKCRNRVLLAAPAVPKKLKFGRSTSVPKDLKIRMPVSGLKEMRKRLTHKLPDEI